MGICVCRKSTGLFCFNHKKAVCTNCVVNHPLCTIRTYVEWLKDSNYQPPVCVACGGGVTEGDAIRLMCLHLYHRKCLDSHCSSYPEHTALAGFCCSVCPKPVIPPMNDKSALACQIRDILSEAQWARRGGFAKPSGSTPHLPPRSPPSSKSAPPPTLPPTHPPSSFSSKPSTPHPKGIAPINSSSEVVMRKGKDHDGSVMVTVGDEEDDMEKKYGKKKGDSSGLTCSKPRPFMLFFLVAVALIILFNFFYFLSSPSFAAVPTTP